MTDSSGAPLHSLGHRQGFRWWSSPATRRPRVARWRDGGLSFSGSGQHSMASFSSPGHAGPAHDDEPSSRAPRGAGGSRPLPPPTRFL